MAPNLSLKKYYAWFLLFCFVFTCLSTILKMFLPSSIAFVLMILPYIVSMILVLYIFLKQQQRAPSRCEMFKFAAILNILFWAFNFIGFLIALFSIAMSQPEVWQSMLAMEFNSQFLWVILLFVSVIAIPFYLLTLWFYGPQAQRMAKHMFH